MHVRVSVSARGRGLHTCADSRRVLTVSRISSFCSKDLPIRILCPAEKNSQHLLFPGKRTINTVVHALTASQASHQPIYGYEMDRHENMGPGPQSKVKEKWTHNDCLKFSLLCTHNYTASTTPFVPKHMITRPASCMHGKSMTKLLPKSPITFLQPPRESPPPLPFPLRCVHRT